MKRNVIYIILVLVFFVGACKKEDNMAENNNLGASIVVSSPGYTSLDNAVTLDVIAYGVTQVTVTNLGGFLPDGTTPFTAPTTNLGTITIAANAGTLVVNDTDLGANVIKTKTNIQFTASKGGMDIIRPLALTVADPITLTLPTVVQSSKLANLIYKVTPKSATVTGVTVETKVSKAGVYSTLAGPFRPAKDTIKINGSLYNVGDTIYYRITASTATRTATKVTSVVVGTYAYANTATVKLDTSYLATNSYDLVKRRLIKTTVAGDSADIAFTQTDILGGYTMGFESHNNAEFVKVTSNASSVYSTGNIVTTQATDFSAAFTAKNDVAVGDVYIFRTKRGTGAYSYGIIKIVTVAKPNGVKNDSYIEFGLKY